MKIGFATSSSDPYLTDDDQLAVAALQRRGVNVTPVLWSAPTPDGADALDALILRSCWDYHRAPEAFAAWLTQLHHAPFPVFNAPSILQWNLHKRYLLELTAAGAPVPPTLLVPAGAPIPPEALAALPGDDLVVKPAISLNGEDTRRVSKHALLDTLLATLLGAPANALAPDRDGLIQPFLPEVLVSGELSLVYLGGRFSHAVRKRPAAGDFRVQVEYGGRREDVTPTDQEREAADLILSLAPGPSLYARVDLVQHQGRPCLIELELIDPTLFLSRAPGAAERFAEAMLDALPA